MEQTASSNRPRPRRIASAVLTALAISVSSGMVSTAATNRESKILDFDTMVGVDRPYTGTANPIRGINGGGVPWVIERGVGKLRADGEITIEVRGLVIPSRGGVNPAAVFKAIVSCLSTDELGFAVIVNRETATFQADTAGNSRIDDRVDLPRPCIAPIVFVTSAGGSWFAASGF